MTAPGRHRAWFVGYGLVGVILIFSQGILLHLENKHKEQADQDLRAQITLLVNASKTQASAGDMGSIRSAISDGFHELEDELQQHPSVNKSKSSAPSRPTSIPPSTPPPIEHIQVAGHRTTSSVAGVPWGWQEILQANDTIQPVAFRVTCDAPVETATAFIAGQVVYMQKGEVYSQNRKAYSFSFSYPAFTPLSPLVVTVFSKQEIHITKIEKIQPIF